MSWTREMAEAHERARDAEIERLRVEIVELRAFLVRAAAGGAIVSSATLAPHQIAIARAANRLLVTPDGLGFVYVSGER